MCVLSDMAVKGENRDQGGERYAALIYGRVLVLLRPCDLPAIKIQNCHEFMLTVTSRTCVFVSESEQISERCCRSLAAQGT